MSVFLNVKEMCEIYVLAICCSSKSLFLCLRLPEVKMLGVPCSLKDNLCNQFNVSILPSSQQMYFTQVQYSEIFL